MIVRIHQSTLGSSKFFTAKAKPEWSKGESTVDLQHISENAFTLYANWAYSGKVMHDGKDLNEELKSTKDVLMYEGTSRLKPEDWQTLAEAVALAEELMDHAFKDSILDTMTFMAAKLYSRAPDAFCQTVLCHALPVRTIYDGTPELSGARKLIIDIFQRYSWFLAKCEDDLPLQFVKDLALKLLGGRGKPFSEPLADACWYHQHANGEACYSTTARDWKAEFGDNH